MGRGRLRTTGGTELAQSPGACFKMKGKTLSWQELYDRVLSLLHYSS